MNQNTLTLGCLSWPHPSNLGKEKGEALGGHPTNHGVGIVTQETEIVRLVDLILTEPPSIDDVADEMDSVMRKEIIPRTNNDFARVQLSKATNQVEPLPTERRQLSSYRTRMGTMLEYAIGHLTSLIIAEASGGGLFLTFISAHQYPDFAIRDTRFRQLIRLEMKAMDSASDEIAPRFDVPTVDIDPALDLAVLIGWKWETLRGADAAFMAPQIFGTVVVPGRDLAAERDERIRLTGGEIRGREVYVPSTKRPGEMVPDPGNYGKIRRIIHSSRDTPDILSPSMQRFRRFIRTVEAEGGGQSQRELGEYRV